MATTTVPGSGEPNVAQLRMAVIDIESMSRTALDEITGIAQLALAYFESPDAYRHPEHIAQALEAIFDRASMASDSVSWEAEQVGLHSKDTRWHRRMAARMTAREQGAFHA